MSQEFIPHRLTSRTDGGDPANNVLIGAMDDIIGEDDFYGAEYIAERTRTFMRFNDSVRAHNQEFDDYNESDCADEEIDFSDESMESIIGSDSIAHSLLEDSKPDCYSVPKEQFKGSQLLGAQSHETRDTHTVNRYSNQKTSWKDGARVIAGAFVPQRLHNRKDSAASTVDMTATTIKMTQYAYMTIMAFLPKLRIGSYISRPFLSYHMVIFISAILTIFGLVMIQSASAVKGITTNGSAYSLFTNQLIFVTLGLVLFFIALRLRIAFLKATAFLGLVLTIGLLIAVLIPGIGKEINSSRRWFAVFGLSLQPSELVKVALCIWGAHLLATRKDSIHYMDLFFPLIPVTLLISVLIVLEPNLSTMIIIILLVGALLWFARLPMRLFTLISAIVLILTTSLALSASYRAQRVMSFLGIGDDPQGANYQAQQAQFALAGGGFFGLGLGQSKAKWNYLPNEHNDFIFAVVGEELGFLGAAALTLVFVLLAVIGIRISLRSIDPFLRLLSGAISVLIAGQAIINIGYVVGLLPVTGVQLPLISAGGTSAFTNLFLLGLLANAARHEPEVVKILANSHKSPSRRRFLRLIRLPAPVAYRPTPLEKTRTRLAAQGIKKNTQPGSHRTPRKRYNYSDPHTYAQDNFSADEYMDSSYKNLVRFGSSVSKNTIWPNNRRGGARYDSSRHSPVPDLLAVNKRRKNPQYSYDAGKSHNLQHLRSSKKKSSFLDDGLHGRNKGSSVFR